jgi:hypothetical protein
MKNNINNQIESRREKYNLLCKEEPTITVFNQAWWLDAIAPNNWDVVFIENDGVIDAALPFRMRKKFGFNIIDQPPFTRDLGPWLRKKELKYSKQLALEKDLLQEIYNKLPDYSFLESSWHYNLKNWLPLYWLGFKQTTRYTYVIDEISNLDKVYSNFEYSKKKNIKKSKGLVDIKFDISARDFYDNHILTLSKEGRKISYSYETFERIYTSAYLNNSAFNIAAYDSNGKLHGALFILKDHSSAYNLISTLDPDFRITGTSSLLVLEAIKEASKYVNRFDFEGSMIESVERSFRQFGGMQVPYFTISNSKSKIYNLALWLRELTANNENK